MIPIPFQRVFTENFSAMFSPIWKIIIDTYSETDVNDAYPNTNVTN